MRVKSLVFINLPAVLSPQNYCAGDQMPKPRGFGSYPKRTKRMRPNDTWLRTVW